MDKLSDLIESRNWLIKALSGEADASVGHPESTTIYNNVMLLQVTPADINTGDGLSDGFINGHAPR